jgi:hypothetical protein
MVWAEMTGRNVDAADAVLQHEKRLSRIARKYAKHDYEVERAALLADWADHAMSGFESCQALRQPGAARNLMSKI